MLEPVSKGWLHKSYMHTCRGSEFQKEYFSLPFNIMGYFVYSVISKTIFYSSQLFCKNCNINYYVVYITACQNWCRHDPIFMFVEIGFHSNQLRRCHTGCPFRIFVGLFHGRSIYRWRLSPPVPIGLTALLQMNGAKKYKTRITLPVCCNATETEKLVLRIIENAKNTCEFRKKSVEEHGFDYRFNYKDWMITVLFMEFIL